MPFVLAGTAGAVIAKQRWSHFRAGNPYSDSTSNYAWVFRSSDWGSDHGNVVRMSLPSPDIDTTDAFKTWLADNPVTVQYPLLNPVTTQLDPIELPILPAPTCTVWSDPTTGLQMEYVQDTNIVIADLRAALADLATT